MNNLRYDMYNLGYDMYNLRYDMYTGRFRNRINMSKVSKVLECWRRTGEYELYPGEALNNTSLHKRARVQQQQNMIMFSTNENVFCFHPEDSIGVVLCIVSCLMDNVTDLFITADIKIQLMIQNLSLPLSAFLKKGESYDVQLCKASEENVCDLGSWFAESQSFFSFADRRTYNGRISNLFAGESEIEHSHASSISINDVESIRLSTFPISVDDVNLASEADTREILNIFMSRAKKATLLSSDALNNCTMNGNASCVKKLVKLGAEITSDILTSGATSDSVKCAKILVEHADSSLFTEALLCTIIEICNLAEILTLYINACSDELRIKYANFIELVESMEEDVENV